MSNVKKQPPAPKGAQKAPPAPKGSVPKPTPVPKAAPKATPPPKAVPAPADKGDGASKKKKAKRHGSGENFDTYIKKVLKKVCAAKLQDAKTINLSGPASATLNGILKVVANEVATIARSKCSEVNRSTVTSKDIRFGADNIFADKDLNDIVTQNIDHVKNPEREAAKQLREEAKKAGTTPPPSNQAPARRESQLGMHISVSVVENIIRDSNSCKLHVSSGASPALAWILENFVRYILEHAVEQVISNKKVTMKPRHIFIAVNSNEKLSTVFKSLNIRFYGVGVMPGINEKLIPSKEEKAKQQKRRKKAAKEKAETKVEGAEGTKKTKRNLPGAKALKDIHRAQEQTGLLIRKGPFDSVVRQYLISRVIENTNTKSSTYHFSDSIIEIIQQFVEDQVISLFNQAQETAIVAGRKGVTAIDVRFVWQHFAGHEKVPFIVGEDETPEEEDKVDMRTINNCGIEALATRGAVGRKGSCIHPEVRHYIQSLLSVLLRSAILNVNMRGAVTITDVDIRHAFETFGVHYIFYRFKKAKKAKKVVTTPIE